VYQALSVRRIPYRDHKDTIRLSYGYYKDTIKIHENLWHGIRVIDVLLNALSYVHFLGRGVFTLLLRFGFSVIAHISVLE